jgi:hypothetical protein
MPTALIRSQPQKHLGNVLCPIHLSKPVVAPTRLRTLVARNFGDSFFATYGVGRGQRIQSDLVVQRLISWLDRRLLPTQPGLFYCLEAKSFVFYS